MFTWSITLYIKVKVTNIFKTFRKSTELSYMAWWRPKAQCFKTAFKTASNFHLQNYHIYIYNKKGVILSYLRIRVIFLKNTKSYVEILFISRVLSNLVNIIQNCSKLFMLLYLGSHVVGVNLCGSKRILAVLLTHTDWLWGSMKAFTIGKVKICDLF